MKVLCEGNCTLEIEQKQRRYLSVKVFIEQNKGVTRWWNSLLNKTKEVLVGENLLRKIVRRVLFTTRNFIRSAKEWTLSVKRIYRNSDTRGWIGVFSQNLSEMENTVLTIKWKSWNSSEVLKSEHGIAWDVVQMQLLDGGEDHHLIITYNDGSTEFLVS